MKIANVDDENLREINARHSKWAVKTKILRDNQCNEGVLPENSG